MFSLELSQYPRVVRSTRYLFGLGRLRTEALECGAIDAPNVRTPRIYPPNSPFTYHSIKELDVGPASDSEDDGGDDGDEMSETDQPGPPQVTQSSSQAAPVANTPAPTRTGNLAQYNRYSQYHTSTWGSFSNPLENIPITSPLETAPPPDFSYMAASNSEYPVYQGLHMLMEEEEDGVEIEPLPLSSLIHVREDTPTPSRRPHTHTTLRRASTNPAVHANVALVSPRTPVRGTSVSHVAAHSPTSGAPRRSQRLQAKVGNSPQKNDREGSGGFSPYSSARMSHRK